MANGGVSVFRKGRVICRGVPNNALDMTGTFGGRANAQRSCMPPMQAVWMAPVIWKGSPSADMSAQVLKRLAGPHT